MAVTVQNLVDFARAHVKLAPIAGIGGVSNEPALTLANKVKSHIIHQTLNWEWNRKSEASFLTVDATEDYTPTATDVYWVERAFAEHEASGSVPKYRYPLKVVRDLPRNWHKGDPEQIAEVFNTSGAKRWRIYPMPSATIWRIYIEYQATPTTLTALTDNFNPIPDTMKDVMTQFFLSHVYKLVGDNRMYLQELAEAERLLELYRAAHVMEESETGFYPDFSLFLG